MKSERESSCARLWRQQSILRPPMELNSPIMYAAKGHLARHLNNQSERPEAIIEEKNTSTIIYEAREEKAEA